MMIDGATRLYCIVGDPVAQTGSPRMFTQRFEALGLNAVLVPFHVPAAQFEPAMRGIMGLANLDGIILTVPFKARVLPFVDKLSPTAQTVGAANALRREPGGSWAGDMFDGRGMVRAIEAGGHSVKGRNALLIGAGGAGSAIACAAAEAGVATLTIADIDADKARALAARVAAAFPSCKLSAGPAMITEHDLLINASPVGMRDGDGLPATIGNLDPQVIVADVVLKDETPLLRHAASCGCAIVRGRAMMENQLDEMLKFFGIRT